MPLRLLHATALAALLLALAAGPASARVDDPLELLGPGVRKALETELANLHAEDLEILIVRKTSAGAPVEALQAYRARAQLVDSGLVLVAVEDQQVGVALGRSYTERGVTNEQADTIAREVMPEAFRAGVPSNGVIDLARRLKQAKALGPRPGYVPPAPPMRTPWEALVLTFLAAVGGGAWAIVSRKRKQAHAQLEERVRGERGRLAKLRDDLRALEERLGDAAITGPEATALRAAALGELPALEAEQAPLREALRGLADRLEAGRVPGAAAELGPLVRRAERLVLRLTVLNAAVAPLFVEAKPLRVRLAEAVSAHEAWLAGEPAGDKRAAARAGLDEAGERLDAGDRVGAQARLAAASVAMAPADPDEVWLARMADPADGPARARALVDRIETLERALADAERRDPEAGRAGREGLRDRLAALESMLLGPHPDLVRAGLLLDATERLQQARGGLPLGPPAPSGVR